MSAGPVMPKLNLPGVSIQGQEMSLEHDSTPFLYLSLG